MVETTKPVCSHLPLPSSLLSPLSLSLLTSVFCSNWGSRANHSLAKRGVLCSKGDWAQHVESKQHATAWAFHGGCAVEVGSASDRCVAPVWRAGHSAGGVGARPGRLIGPVLGLLHGLLGAVLGLVDALTCTRRGNVPDGNRRGGERWGARRGTASTWPWKAKCMATGQKQVQGSRRAGRQARQRRHPTHPHGAASRWPCPWPAGVRSAALIQGQELKGGSSGGSEEIAGVHDVPMCCRHCRDQPHLLHHRAALLAGLRARLLRATRHLRVGGQRQGRLGAQARQVGRAWRTALPGSCCVSKCCSPAPPCPWRPPTPRRPSGLPQPAGAGAQRSPG